MNDRRTPHDPVADRLRAALSEHAETIEPSTDGLDRIEERLMTEPTNPTNRRWLLGVGGVAAALLIGAVAFIATSDDDAGVATESSTTTEPTTTTTEATTTTTEAPFTTDVDPYGVAYPSPETSQRFQAPEPAAINYARDVLGFTELVTGEFLEGDSRSGEVVVTDREGGPETVIIVRQMDDDTWYVLASQTADIVVDTPSAGDEVTAPMETTGEALAFEGTVDVLVRSQTDPEPLGEGFVTGSGTPPAGPFEGEIDFTAPARDTPGIVVYRTLSAEDGHVVLATSFPVLLLGA